MVVPREGRKGGVRLERIEYQYAAQQYGHLLQRDGLCLRKGIIVQGEKGWLTRGGPVYPVGLPRQPLSYLSRLDDGSSEEIREARLNWVSGHGPRLQELRDSDGATSDTYSGLPPNIQGQRGRFSLLPFGV